MSEGYLGNQNLKKIGSRLAFNQQEIDEYILCAEDPKHFIKNHCKIVSLDDGLVPFRLYKYQENFIDILQGNRWVISMQPRQSGKSQLVAAYILWFCIFHSNTQSAILANKASAAREILSRFKLMYEYLPKFLQQGVKTWNKGDVELENGAKVFCSATTGDGIRGKSCVTGDTNICVVENDNIYIRRIDFINNSRFIEKENMLYTVYKTTNNTNGKIYIGFHQTSAQPAQTKKIGSIYEDGYMGSGKWLKDAFVKYGMDSFGQELLGVFDNKTDAENLERTLVNKEFVDRDDTYNLSIGGNVCILYGEDNGFYGKKHSEEFKQKIGEFHKGNKYFSNSAHNDWKIVDNTTGKIYLDHKDFFDEHELGNKSFPKLFDAIKDGKYSYVDEDRQKQALEIVNSKMPLEERSKLFSRLAKERFTGTTQSPEHVQKRTKALKSWIKEHQEERLEWIVKINKNPEKIRKTAEAHRGMKRSSETCKNISNALKGKPSYNKGIKVYHDPVTMELFHAKPGDVIPNNLLPGIGKKHKDRGTAYNNGVVTKYFNDVTLVPDGWQKGFRK